MQLQRPVGLTLCLIMKYMEKKLEILMISFLFGIFLCVGGVWRGFPGFFFSLPPSLWCFLIDQHKLVLSWLCTVHCKMKLLSWFMASRLW